ncbi:UNVERIFIED_CONTAM: hypothetical protein Sradi_1750100 [Sesamum radiatum]|uniref:Uncharacterized protein n=1 Tax=Sesamum radiatum TaxID=300843 RepID=A0AAW2TV91_SESRA
MGDDDTVFVTDNLVRILNKYDHNQYYYIGSSSESHLQNIYFSYGMAYGGGGFAISYPLAKALEKIQDRCIQRYPGLYGSDDRMQACMAELGVPLTKELGFHQVNFQCGTSSYPVGVFAPSRCGGANFPEHHPSRSSTTAENPHEAGFGWSNAAIHLLPQTNGWTISVSWGFAVQIFRGVMSPREIEMPPRTFLNWYRRADYKAYAFNTRPVMRNPCQKPFIFYLSTARTQSHTNQTVSEYTQHRDPHPACKWKMADPADIDQVEVYKKPDPKLWDRVRKVLHH